MPNFNVLKTSKMKRKGFVWMIPVVMLLTGMLAGCQKDESENQDDELAKSSLLNLMQEWYLWYDQLPVVNLANYDSPYTLLEALRYNPVDRWSYISTWDEFMQYYSAGEYIGFGFGNMMYNGKIYIAFVFKDSPLYAEGIRRGWYINKINGQTITSFEQYFSAIGDDEVGLSRTLELVGPEGQVVTKTFAKKVIDMNTLLYADTLHVADKIVGHMVLKSFIQPTYDELDSIFLVFKNQGVNELILDLRYNGGGQVDVCTYLASQISGPATDGQTFVVQEYNDKKTDQNITVPFTGSGLETPASQLGLTRLVVLASAGTASASEAVINGLKSYMDVVVIGDDTYGKPVGMNVWNYRDTYAYVPVTFKLTNKDGFGDYYDGLPADSYIPDDPTRAFGDRQETTLAEAIYYLETGAFTGAGKKKSVPYRIYPERKGLQFEIGAF